MLATKKKRKSPKLRKPPAPPKFSVRDQVPVKYGVADPNFSDIPLGGWAGTITEVEQRGRFLLYLVEWNQFTLDNMHPVVRKRCKRDSLEEASSWLGEEDMEADVGEPVPMEQPTNIVTRPLASDNQDDRIRAILGLTSDAPLPEANGENLFKYHAYLAAHLSFPFLAIHWRDTGPFQSQKYKASVAGLTDLDDYYPTEGHGLLCEVRHDADTNEPTTIVQGRAKDRGVLLGFLWKMLGLSGRQEEGNFSITP